MVGFPFNTPRSSFLRQLSPSASFPTSRYRRYLISGEISQSEFKKLVFFTSFLKAPVPVVEATLGRCCGIWKLMGNIVGKPTGEHCSQMCSLPPPRENWATERLKVEYMEMTQGSPPPASSPSTPCPLQLLNSFEAWRTLFLPKLDASTVRQWRK